MTEGQKNILTLVAALIIIAFFAAVAYGIWQRQQSEKLVNTFGDDVIALCNPPSGGNANPNNTPRHAEIFKTLVLPANGGAKFHAWYHDIIDDAKAKNKDELDIIICLGEPIEETLEVCEYVPISATSSGVTVFTITRVRYFVTAVLINARNGNRIQNVKVYGGDPELCPDRERAEQGTNEFLRGTKPTSSDFLRAMQSYLVRRPR